jgi:hypothetical protein
MKVRYDMTAVRNAVKRIAREQIRRAVGDGQDSSPVRPTRYDPGGRGLGATGVKSVPISFPHSEPKFQIKWHLTDTPDGDIVGRLVWTLLGHSGAFPVVTDYVGDVSTTAHPTYFSDQDHAAQVAEDCATGLREQFAQMFDA